MSNGKSILITVLAVTAAFLILGFWGLVLMLVFALATPELTVPLIAIPLVVISLVYATGSGVYGLCKRNFPKKHLIIAGTVIILSVISFGIEFYYFEKYIPSITMNDSGSHSIYDYRPFSDSKLLVRTEGECELRFDDAAKVPRMDGATALAGVYCSFAENIYPASVSYWCDKEHIGIYTENDAQILCSGTREAYRNLINGSADIIFVAQPSESQLEDARKAGVSLKMTPIGREAFVFMVNYKNPVSDLSSDEIKKIYSGEYTNWNEIGGPDWKIRPFQRNKNSGSQTAFLSFMGKTVPMIPEKVEVADVMGGMVEYVADYQNHKNAIGYSFRYFVEEMTANKTVKLLSVDHVEPSRENIKSGKYPLTNYFYAVTVNGRETENTKRLVQWILSEQGQSVIEKAGYSGL